MGKIVHGLRHHELYPIWVSMKQRCLNQNHPAYYRYGGRGVTVHPRWIVSFPAFLADMGPRPDGLTLERAKNELGYSPENCRWASRSDQAKNKAPQFARLDAHQAMQRKKKWLQSVQQENAKRRLKPQPCVQCDKSFVRSGGENDRKFCSRACYAAARIENRVTKPCAQCGKQFYNRRHTASFCSKPCFWSAQKERYA